MIESTIIHVPHSSRFIPNEFRKQFVLTEEELTKELNVMTDGFTSSLFDVGLPKIVYPISRLVCDPERFRSDENEPMAKIGMGVIYQKTSNKAELRQLITSEEKEYLLKKYYDTHHEKLTKLVDEKLAQYGGCLIIDSHSFSEIPLPYEQCQETNRSDFCIGTDSFHTPKKLKDMAITFLQDCGFSVSENIPYSGSIVPMKHYKKDERVHSVMIEVNRKLYLGNDFLPNQQFRKIKVVIQTLIEELSEYLDT